MINVESNQGIDCDVDKINIVDINLNKAGIVQKYNNNRSDKSLDYVEIGYMIVEKGQTLAFYETSECSFSSVLKKMAAQHQISAWIQRDAYHSISDPERWKKTEEYLKPKKIILIDRDGVINKKAPRGGYVTKWEYFSWIDETREAMKTLAQKGFEFIVISNQAGLERGMLDYDELEKIHHKMKGEIQKDGVKILDIYVCPHHWNDNCQCRKPNPGLFFKASREYMFRLDKAIFIGDDPRDCKAAINEGCSSIFIGNEKYLNELEHEDRPIYSSESLLDSINTINNFYNNF